MEGVSGGAQRSNWKKGEGKSERERLGHAPKIQKRRERV
jgi:hypothetical protein